MNVYFGASISYDRSMLETYQRIVEALKQLGHRVVSDHVVDPKLVPGGGLDPDILYARETKAIEKVDVMVAEVTVPSWGTAFLMEHALEHDIPVLALFYQEAQVPLPMMVKGHPELYVQHYDNENIKVVLDKSLSHFALIKDRKGKLIVIDGGDGSGKATQTTMLLDYFDRHKIPSKYIAFPRYKTSFHGRHVGRFLTGEFGGGNEVSPYLSSLAFALDRLTSRTQIMEWLKEGRMVVADRYVSASMAFQGSKLEGAARQEFLEWLYSMEYKEHKLPKEDIVIFLYVPLEVAQKLLESTQAKGMADGKDIYEADLEHQRKSIEMYRELSAKYSHWEMVSCVDDAGQLMSKEAIHEKVLAVLQEREIIGE